jgi:hypothetical protein
MEEERKSPIHILWTGGWDSTFRLLQVLLLERRIVQPFYVMDSDRQSTGVEIRTMKDIKTRLFKTRPETRDRLLPAYFKEVFDIAPAPRLTETFDRIRGRRSIGSQYEWLARFCEEIGVDDMELGIHKDGNMQRLLKPFSIKSDDEGGLRYRVDPALEGSDEYTLFRYFRFPIFELSKLEMQAIARRSGFDDVMELTWFCHSPRAGFRPCGICNPCVYTMEEGLGRRIPFASRVRFHLSVVSRLKYFVRKRPELYVFSRRVKRVLGL